MSDMHQTYLETLQTLFHTLQLYDYKFEETLLTQRNINTVFKKIIEYEHDDENSDYFGDMVTSKIRVNIELDRAEFSANVKEENINLKKAIDELRKPSKLPNVNVPKRPYNEIYDEEKNIKTELQLLLQILGLHCEYVDTIITQHNVANAVFKCSMSNKILVKVEFISDEIVDEEYLLDEEEENDEVKMNGVVEGLLNAPAARGKRKNQPAKKTKRKTQRRQKRKPQRRQSRKTQRRQSRRK
jgi:hypothetical protein